MGSDRARVSYNPDQLYRSLVMQQGRVTLEADWNEAQTLTDEEIRSQALDFVGPSGTPDDGYNVVPAHGGDIPPYDFFIRSGTMYVGGVRAELPEPVQYSMQSDWLDSGGDPYWVDVHSIAEKPPNYEFVYAFLREQEIGAVEDPDLKDIALGGPDTAQRTRLIQHFVRVASPSGDCASGLAAAEAQWANYGLEFDPDTMRLASGASLLVGFTGQTTTSNCEPQAQGGYIGPDNQLIRVQLSGRDKTTGRPKLLWGLDDASFLYRIDVDPNNPQQLNFQSPPVDQSRQPVSGQAVEILRSAAELSNGASVAAASGFVVTLDQSYQPDTQSIELPDSVSLPSEYLTGNQSPPAALYLRVWQQEMIVPPNTAIALANTGLSITIQTEINRPFHLGDFWLFAVRPATPQTVYPERYQNTFQPPDGPLMWACPLGVIEWQKRIGTLVSDCRNSFDNLVDLGKRWQGCCTYTVRPEDLTGSVTLQSIVNKAASATLRLSAVSAGSMGNTISVAITNVQRDATPATFDLTLTETDVYALQTNAHIEGVIGDDEGAGTTPGLAHVLAGSVKTQSSPENQTVVLKGGAAQKAAQADIHDSRGNVVFTLQAKNVGTDGNLITAIISNSSLSSPATYDLTFTWTKTLRGLTLTTLVSQMQSQTAYEVNVTGFSPSIPAEGVTILTGGQDASTAANGSTPAANARGVIYGSPATICLRPGTYRLSSPLLLGPAQGNLAIEACGGEAIIAVSPKYESSIDLGMLQLVNTGKITLKGLTFAMQADSFFESGNKLGNLSQDALYKIGESSVARLTASVAVRMADCQSVTVKDCTFQYPAIPEGGGAIYAGIFANGECSNVSIRANNFNGPMNLLAEDQASTTVIVGYFQISSLSFGDSDAINRLDAGSLILSMTSLLSFRDNQFQNLEYAVYLDARVGRLEFMTNRVTACARGLTITSLIGFGYDARSQVAFADTRSLSLSNQVLSDPDYQDALTIGAAYPLPDSYQPARRVPLVQSAHTSPPAPATPTPAAPPAPAGTAQLAATNAVVVTSTPLLQSTNVKPFASEISQALGSFFLNSSFIILRTPPPDLTMRIDISNNDMDMVPGTNYYAIYIDATQYDTEYGWRSAGLLVMTANRITVQSSGAVALYLLARCTVTGNIVLNTQAATPSVVPLSLLISQTTALGERTIAAVTGNVFQGAAYLPARYPPASPPEEPWITYNTQI
jgi:Family of unknown function (DUF6519)